MGILFRWLLRLLVGSMLLAALSVAILYWFLSRSLTDPSGQWVAEGISAPVEIVRDTAAIPHVFASSDADVYFGLGFAHAQDRLWQMTMLRRTAQGRLSELFGQRTLAVDDLLRRLDIAGLARRSLDAQDADTVAMLDAYAMGVNAWLAEVRAGARGRGAPEFFLFEPRIEPWVPADSVALIKLMGLQLSSHLEAEVIRARLSLIPSLGTGRVDDLLPEIPGDGIAALEEYAALFPAAESSYAALDIPDEPLSPFKRRAFAGASNGWAAAPSRSAAGGSLLANDPHLGFSAPSIWYLARLDLASGAVIGGTIPGIPVVLTGRSETLGWGLTSAYVDDQDVYVERLDPEDESRYLTPNGYRAFQNRPAIIEVADASPVTINRRWTENGPVLPGTHYDLASITPPGHVTSLAWTVLSPADTSMTAARRLMEAQDIEGAIAATEGYIAPAMNLTLADAEGVALKTIGAIPARRPEHQSMGRLPSPGWIAANRWQGRQPYARNPAFTDPPGGIVGNTNNKIVDRPFPDHVSFTWGDSQRVNRWRRLMQSREVHTRESFIEAQLDIVSFTARSILPLIGRDLWFTSEAAPEGTVEAQRKSALDLLAEWNGEMSEHRPEPLIYATWLRFLQQRLIRDEIGPLAAEFSHPEPLFLERVFRDEDGASAWCDVRQSAPVETCADIARAALDEAVLWIGEEYGTALESLRWGDAHEAAHDHPVLGDVPVVRWLVNIRQSTSGGDNTLMRGRTAGSGPAPFRNVHGAGFRGVYDFADPDSSVFVISTGQSGHPLSRHYEDLGELWRRGEYVPMRLDPDLARAGADGITTIVPGAR